MSTLETRHAQAQKKQLIRPGVVFARGPDEGLDPRRRRPKSNGLDLDTKLSYVN